jgi:biotin carboxyl carrier protein
MKFEVRVGTTMRTVEIESEFAGGLRFRIDGRAVIADAAEIPPDTYSILLAGRLFEVQVRSTRDGLLAICGGQEFPVHVRDPRSWRGAQGPLPVAEGRQQVTAPMPGKVVRVLIAAGQTVEASQGLVVVEAMKMQNEIKAPKAGRIERLFVKENDTVGAGEPLAVIV